MNALVSYEPITARTTIVEYMYFPCAPNCESVNDAAYLAPVVIEFDQPLACLSIVFLLEVYKR